MGTPLILSYQKIDRTTTWYYTGGTTPIISTQDNLWRYGYQSRPESVSNRRRDDGTRPPSPWSNTWAHVTGSVFDVQGQIWESPTRYVDAVDCANFPALQPAGFNSRLSDAAMLDALTKLKNSKVNLGVMLAEARQTAQLLGSVSERIGRSIDAWRRKRPGDLRKWAASGWKGIPSSYLENCYGWTPLLGDVYNSAEALADAWHGTAYQPQFTVGGRSKATTEREVMWRGQFTGSRCPHKGVQVEEAHVVLCMILPKYLLQPLVQTGLTNPFSVAWEKVPYSFVADWVFPVGNWLNALDAGAYTTFREGSLSRISRFEGTSLTESDGNALWSIRAKSPGRFSTGEFQRSVIHSLPTFPPLPSLKSPLSLDKMAKGISLLTQSLKRLEMPKGIVDKIPRYIFK